MSEPSPRDPSIALALQGIDKRFGSTQALAAASLLVRPGTVHALLGENGAGKSTLMRIAYGLLHPDAGSIGGHGPLDLRRVARKLRELSARTGFALDGDARVESLSVAAQQRVEITKALVRDARLLVLDEPTAVLPPSESTELLRWLRAFADQGNAVVLITHKLPEAMRVADDVTVLHRGRTVLTAPRAETSIESLTEAMLGAADRDLMGHHRRAPVLAPEATTSRAVVFRAERITVADAQGVVRVREASFVVTAGEIV